MVQCYCRSFSAQALEPSFSSIAQQFMHRLTFVGDRRGPQSAHAIPALKTHDGIPSALCSPRCMDALGQRWKVTDDHGTLYLIKGRIWVSGNVLFREGKSGIAAGSATAAIFSSHVAVYIKWIREHLFMA